MNSSQAGIAHIYGLDTILKEACLMGLSSLLLQVHEMDFLYTKMLFLRDKK